MEWPQNTKKLRNDVLMFAGSLVVDGVCALGMAETPRPSGLEAATIVGGAGAAALVAYTAVKRLLARNYHIDSFEVVDSYINPGA